MTATDIAAAAGAVVGVITAVTLLWTRIVRPLARLDAAMPAMLGLAEEFHPSKGETLRHLLEQVESNLADADTRLSKLEEVEDRRDVEMVNLAVQVSELYDYSHDWRHRLANDLAAANMRLGWILTGLGVDGGPHEGEEGSAFR